MKQKKKSKSIGLGSGLSSLLGSEVAKKSENFQMVPVELIKPGPWQPRKSFNTNVLLSLSDSIKEQGIIQPIILKSNKKIKNQYFIIAGERRWRACQLAKIHEIPAVIRDDLNEGDITKREIFTIDPFNNGSVTYSMTVGEIRNFLKETGVGIYYSGFDLVQNNDAIEIYNTENQLLNDNTNISVGLNDYIPAVYDTYFTQTPTFLPNTTAETIINYLYNNQSPIDYTSCSGYFKYQ